jgi:hypothetical protein
MTGRPTWVIVLTSLMLLFAAQLFFTALTTLNALRLRARTPSSSVSSSPPLSVAPPVAASSSFGTPEEQLARELGAASAALDRAHPDAMRAHALARLALALVLFYAVASVFSYDRRGRKVALLAGWLGILYHVGNALFFIFVIRETFLALAPGWVKIAMQQSGPMKDLSGRDWEGIAHTLTLVIPIAVAAGGVAFSFVLLAFFGGRRGRSFYGVVDPRAGRLPDPGG